MYISDKFTQRKNARLVKPIFLYSIQYDIVANKWLYITNYGKNITFDGIEYEKAIIQHGGFSENLSGRIEKTSLTIANADKEMQYYLGAYNALRKRKVLIKLVFEEDLDDTNVVDEQEYYIDDATATPKIVTLTLGSKFDILTKRKPGRTFIPGYCRFRFKGIQCGYSGSETICDKLFSTCISYGNVNRTGSFPAMPMKRGM